MSLHDEDELRRFIRAEVARAPSRPTPAVVIVKDGPPTDSDFPSPPSDGVPVVDRVNSFIYVRVGGTWKKAALT